MTLQRAFNIAANSPYCFTGIDVVCCNTTYIHKQTLISYKQLKLQPIQKESPVLLSDCNFCQIIVVHGTIIACEVS